MGEKKFGTMITNEGAALIADCILRGEVLPITTAAAGDGGGAYYEPSADQTALRNECWRGEIAGFALSEYAANMLDVKVIIDDEAGGFTIREMGLFTADGIMVAVCNTPDTEKITVTGGLPGRLTMVMHIIVADSNAVEIVVNPELDVVTPNQLDSKIALHDSDPNAHVNIVSKSVEISSRQTPAVGVKTHYYVIADVAGYVPHGYIPEGVENGYVADENGEFTRASVNGDNGISPMALKFD